LRLQFNVEHLNEVTWSGDCQDLIDNWGVLGCWGLIDSVKCDMIIMTTCGNPFSSLPGAFLGSLFILSCWVLS